ncbi:MAG: hypothetical protein ABSH03_18565 [Candidatus Lustribacter sp.]
MSPEVPAVLAVAGTALLAMAFFGPFRRTGETTDPGETAVPKAVLWPALVEPSATACDVPARIDMADALGALHSAWAEAILRKAYDTEPDPAVRSVIATALSSTQSLVM